jgi:hypothetical protein
VEENVPDFDMTADTVPKEVIKLYRNGSNLCLNIRKIIMQEILKNPAQVFPTIVNWKGVDCVAFYFEPPQGYDRRPYRVYRIKRNGCYCYYLPIPKYLVGIVSSHRGSLARYSIGKDLAGNRVVVLEKCQ